MTADPLTRQAAEIVTKSRFASTDSLQQRLDITATQANRIMTTLEDHDIVGASRNGQPREILAQPRDLDRLLGDGQ